MLITLRHLDRGDLILLYDKDLPRHECVPDHRTRCSRGLVLHITNLTPCLPLPLPSPASICIFSPRENLAASEGPKRCCVIRPLLIWTNGWEALDHQPAVWLSETVENDKERLCSKSEWVTAYFICARAACKSFSHAKKIALWPPYNFVLPSCTSLQKTRSGP